ncbi:hypothetical protein BKA67DRAFT_534968 [Truncatella angustata]|uniref:Allergen n=1 Tax=Truncatella angustata TaxID=152316 RepID=A0A9P8UPX2_9PEZI|nr:uncharacterized protein BKA67DRAFT_534968 [Truncatella angustata]KAH6656067.1 hypothetical protein BKA67DRAFT_534968 [Truncatella angustata]KAH8198411.1 hypothetical protein TruAng_007446 [Truncatella angustata]
MASNLPSNTIGKATESLRAFMSQADQNDTTVDREEARTVEHETVKPSQHEEITTAVDKEVHQDHYHRTVQPIKEREVLPDKHSFKQNQTKHKEFDNRDDTAARKHQQESGKFHDEREVEATKYTKEQAQTKQGEHIHHHIHETVQPVINKETFQREVVHTINPVHETHHLAARDHGTTTAPEIDASQYKTKAGTQRGGATHTRGYMKGQPQDMGGVENTVKETGLKGKPGNMDFDPEDEGVAGHQEPSILSGLNPFSK